ncbi:MAG: PD-(D/E)XK nuclease family protein [Candidatus Eisenbacteria bacterium]
MGADRADARVGEEYEADRGPWLRGFLARLDALESSGGIKGPRPGGVDDAVLLLTVHRSKGLQFPLVILPRLAWQFRDDHQLGSRMRIGRTEAGIRALDWEHWSRRDTLLRSLLAQEAKRAGREEEARVLYVAMTRAQERLVLLAAARKTPVLDHDVPRPLAARRVLAAGDALTWILDALPWQSAESGEDGSLRFEREAWWVFPHAPSAEEAKVAPPDDLAPAPSLRSALEVALAKTRATERPSAALAQAGIRGKYWVTEFKRQEDFARRDAIASDDGAALWLPAAADAEAGANLGTRFHGALQRIDLARSSEAELDAQFAAIAEEPWWDGAERATALEQGFQRFLASPLGRRLVEASADRRVEREVAFSLRWPVRRLAARRDELRAWLEAEGSRLGSSLDEAWVLLQGRIDCVFREGDRHVVIDWKTDRVRRETLDARVEAYRVQMELYREAVSALWGASVESWLVFLALGESIEIGAST